MACGELVSDSVRRVPLLACPAVLWLKQGRHLWPPAPSYTHITRYTWDHRNRLTRVEQFADHAAFEAQQPDRVVEYAYDFGNRWVRRVVDTDGAGSGHSARAGGVLHLRRPCGLPSPSGRGAGGEGTRHYNFVRQSAGGEGTPRRSFGRQCTGTQRR